MLWAAGWFLIGWGLGVLSLIAVERILGVRW